MTPQQNQVSPISFPPAGLHFPPGGGVTSGHMTQQGYADTPAPHHEQPTQPPYSYAYQAPAMLQTGELIAKALLMFIS